MASVRKPYSLLWNRDYLLLWSGQFISDTGSGISAIAYPLLILVVTNSPAQAGLVSALRSLIYILGILPAGVLLDRLDRKLVMILCDLGRVLAMGCVFVLLELNNLTIALIYITGCIESLLAAFFDIAEVSCLPQVVEKERLPAALGQFQLTSGVVNLVSKPLGGILYGLQASLPFLVDAVSYIVSVCSLSLIRKSFQEHREVPKRHWRTEMSEGLHWLWKQPLLRTMALLTSVNVFLGAGQTLIIIVLAQQQHASNATIGLIFGIGSLGSVLGAFLSGQAQRRFSFAQVIIGALWFYAVFWLWLAVLPPPLLLSVITALLFFIGPFYNVAHTSRRLMMTPDLLQGRVNSVSHLISFGFAPLGLALTGLLLQYLGLRETILLSVCGQVLLAMIATINTHIRQKPTIEE